MADDRKKVNRNIRLGLQQSALGQPPKCDLAYCEYSECGWRGLVADCEEYQEGTWETGYYTAHLCPKCGEPVHYDMSEQCSKELTEWYENRRNHSQK